MKTLRFNTASGRNKLVDRHGHDASEASRYSLRGLSSVCRQCGDREAADSWGGTCAICERDLCRRCASAHKLTFDGKGHDGAEAHAAALCRVCHDKLWKHVAERAGYSFPPG